MSTLIDNRESPATDGLRKMLRTANQLTINNFPTRAPERHLYVYNTSPWRFTRALGSLGTFTIHECKEGQDYAELFVKIPDPFYEHYPAGNRQVNYREWPGLDIVRDILGIMPPAHEDNDLTKKGIFASEHNPPLPAEVEEATEKLVLYCRELCHEGDLMAGGDDMSRNAIRNSGKHKIAAKRIGYEADWCTLPRLRVPCPACGGMMVKGVAIHNDPMCGAIIDEEKARKYMPHLFAEPEEKREKKQPRTI